LKLEVIATTVADAIAAEQGGADRIELISNAFEGGLTPSFGLIQAVLKKVRIPVHVMIRPHSNSFRYTPNDIEVMKIDINISRDLGASGIVLGVLNEQQGIDVHSLSLLLSNSGELSVTFHRAFDEVKDQRLAMAVLSSFPSIHRILTSGGQPEVCHATTEIRELIEYGERSRSHISIVAGSGLTVENLPAFLDQTGVTEVHFGSGVREFGSYRNKIDRCRLEQIRHIIENKKRCENSGD
jgi:copper homeostasis protein